MLDFVSGVLSNLISNQVQEALNEYLDKKILNTLADKLKCITIKMEFDNPDSIICKDCFHQYMKSYNVINKFVEFHIKVSYLVEGNTTKNYIENEIKKCTTYLSEKKLIVTPVDQSIISTLLTMYEQEIVTVFNKQLSNNESYMISHTDKQFAQIYDEIQQLQRNVLTKEEFKSMLNSEFSKTKNLINEELIKDNKSIDANDIHINTFLEGVVNVSNNPNLNIRLKISANELNVENDIRISVCVKRQGIIAKFDNTNLYINYLTFTGKQDELEIVNYKILNEDNVIAQGELKDVYTGAVCYLPTYVTKTIEIDSLLLNVPTIFEYMVLKVIPPIQSLVFDIEDFDNVVIVNNLEVGIIRHLDNDKLEVILKDMRKNTDVMFNIHLLFKGFNLESTLIKIVPVEQYGIRSQLSYYQLLHKLSTCKKIILREKSTFDQFMSANIIVDKNYSEKLTEVIEFYKKLLRIQDHFKLKFNVPKKIEADNIRLVGELDNLLKKGITRTQTYTLTIKKSNFEKTVNVGDTFLFSCTFKEVELFGQLIDLEEVTLLLPKTTLSKIIKKKYIFVSEEPCLCIWNKKYGEFSITELASEVMNKYKSSDNFKI